MRAQKTSEMEKMGVDLFVFDIGRISVYNSPYTITQSFKNLRIEN